MEELKNFNFERPTVQPISDPDFVSKVHIVESEEDFDDQVKNAGDKLVVVDFTASWCGPCKNVSPRLDEFSVKYESQIVLLKVDVDALNELAMHEFRVTSMPTFVFLKNGKSVERFSGSDAGRIEDTIKRFSE